MKAVEDGQRPMRYPQQAVYNLSAEEPLRIPDLDVPVDTPPIMFGGYAEVAGLYTEDDFLMLGEDEEGHEPLPRDYIPIYSPPDPWSGNATCADDFILVAEFSEQEGPKPLITIPQNAGGSFDLNEFSVRIMSVDYQGVTGDNFSASQDTQVIVSESHHCIYAYVHHFTLHDSQARGFVRPFCMSFVTPRHSKLISFYEELHAEFSKVSQCFKYGNLMTFVRDMTHYLSDLHFTKERYIERSNALKELAELEQQVASIVLGDEEEEAILQSITLQSIDHVIDEVRAILEATSDLMENEKDVVERIRKLEEKYQDNGDELNMANFHYSCSLHSNGSGSASQADGHKTSELFSETNGFNSDYDIYRPRVVRTTNKKRYDKSLRTLHELCQYGATEGLKRLHNIHKYFSRDLSTLHMEKKDSQLIDPAAGLLTIGRNVELNFHTGLRPGSSSPSEMTSNGDMLTASSLTESSIGKWLSDDTFGSVGSFHSAESFLSCQDEYSPPRLSTKSAYHPTLGQGNLILPDTSSIGSTVASDVTNHSQVDNHQGRIMNSSQMSETQSICSSLSTTESAQGTSGESQSSTKQDISGLVEERTEVAHQPVRVSVTSSADHITTLNTSSPGYGLLEVVRKLPFTPHMLYSLLCGRPLVIVGSTKMEAEVHSLVTSLWLFVPGHSSHSEGVVSWSTKPIRICDLTRARLIGLGKSERRTLDSILPSSVRAYVSMLDLEKKTLSAPQYKGGVLTDIYNKRKVFQDESSYVAYVHGVLYELCMKAYAFYHGFSLNSTISDTLRSRSQFPDHRQKYQTAFNDFCTKLKLNEQDAQIIQYLSEVVKQQEIYELNVQRYPENDVPVTSIKLDYQKCKTFKVLS